MINLYKMIQYTGMAAGVLLVVTASIGLSHSNVELHEKFGITTVAVGLLHGGLVIYRNLKNKSKAAVK